MAGHFYFRGLILKQAKSFHEQIEILKSRKLIIENEQNAIDFLNKVNYYRLSGFFKLFSNCDEFNDGITFEMIQQVYEFDSKLRNLLNEILEYIEILLKSQIAYNIGTTISPLAYLDSSIYVDESKFNQLKDEINDCVTRKYKNEEFIKHHVGKDIPIWAIVEVMSFGNMSMMFSNLKKEHQDIIANTYLKTKSYYLKNHMYVLTNIRNTCAHRSRIYGKYFVLAPRIGDKDKQRLILNGVNIANSSSKIFIFIYIMLKYTNNSYNTSFISRLKKLIEEYKSYISLDEIGFPENWEEILSVF